MASYASTECSQGGIRTAKWVQAILESLSDVERSIQLPERSEIGPIECSQIQCSDRDCGSPFWVALGDPLQSLSHIPSGCAVVVNWTYLRARWELDGPLNIGVCLEEGHNSFDDAYSTLGALNQSFWTIFVLKDLYRNLFF